MKNIILTFNLVFFLFGCSSSDENKPEKENPNVVLKCKFNPGALYEDTYSFFSDNSVVVTSTNKSREEKRYKLIVQENMWVLSGTKTITENGVTSRYPDTEIFVVSNDNLSAGIYYREDYETDPFKFMVCDKKIQF